MVMTEAMRMWAYRVPASGAMMLGLCIGGVARAQQPIVAKAARPALAPMFQVEPTPPQPPDPPQAGAAVKDDLFAGTEKFAKGASDVTEVTMDPDSLSLVDGDAAKKAHRTVLSVVRTYSYDKPGMYNPADVDEYRRKLETGDWHCSLHTRDLKSGESTDICSRRRAPDMIENAIITMEPKELTFIHTIKKVNGQGGGLDLGEMPEMFMHLPPNVTMAMMQPEMAAEIMAQTAGIRARMPEMMESLRSAQKLSSHEVQEQMKKLQREMNGLPILPELSPEQLRKQQEDMQKLQQGLNGTKQP